MIRDRLPRADRGAADRGNRVTGGITGTNIDSFDTDVPGLTVGGSITLTGVQTVPYLSLLATRGLPDLDTDGASFLTGVDVRGTTVITKSSADVSGTTSACCRR